MTKEQNYVKIIILMYSLIKNLHITYVPHKTIIFTPPPPYNHCFTYLFIFRFVTTVSLLIKFKVCLLLSTTLEDASGAINFCSSSSVLLRGTTESSSSSSESSSPSSIESRIPSVDALLFFSENSSLSSR